MLLPSISREDDSRRSINRPGEEAIQSAMEGRTKRILAGFVFHAPSLSIGRLHTPGIENRISKWLVSTRGIVVDKEKYTLALGVPKRVNSIE